MTLRRSLLFSLALWLALGGIASAEEKRATRPHLADYNSALRLANGRVDIDGLVKRLKELGVNTYYWLIWHEATDWDDLKLFLPKAAEAKIEVWVYLVPPSESPPQYGDKYSEPFRLDYVRWGEEIARLSLEHSNLTAWVIDDFYYNREFFTPMYLAQMQKKSKDINPQLAFLPLLYFRQIEPQFVAAYQDVIDGMVVAYLQNREEIERVHNVLNQAVQPHKAELRFPWKAVSQEGDFVQASQSCKVESAAQYKIRFEHQDDYEGSTAGYHFKQIMVDGKVVWEEDVSGGKRDWQPVEIDLTDEVRGKPSVTLTFRLFDKRGVGNFGVIWRLREFKSENLAFPGNFTEPQKWKAAYKGIFFETGFGLSKNRSERLTFISMTLAVVQDFPRWHSEVGSPERVGQKLRVSLEALRAGKCDGVVTYCLDKKPESTTFSFAKTLFQSLEAPASKPQPTSPISPRD